MWSLLLTYCVVEEEIVLAAKGASVLPTPVLELFVLTTA
jgi:hypothetical protein